MSNKQSYSRYNLLLQCRQSDQMSDQQWQEHLKDEVFVQWLKKQGIKL